MLPMFPNPYPDEIFYSVMARYHFWSRGKSCSATIGELFGTERLAAIVDFPCGLSFLRSQLPTHPSMKEESLIQKHTFFPLYQPFLTHQKVDAIVNKLKAGGNSGGGVHSFLGYGGSSTLVFSPTLRYCLCCVEEDIQRYGEAYWHRLHQISIVQECPIHHQPFETSNVPFRDRQHKYQVVDLNGVIKQPLRHSIQDFNIDQSGNADSLSSNAKYILNHHIDPIGGENLKSKYVYLLKSAGYASHSGRVKISKLSEDFVAAFGKHFLEMLGCFPSFNNDNNWLNSFSRSLNAAISPIRHLLMMNFLNISAEDFFSLNPVDQPFGSGPWPCLNIGADHYRKEIVYKLDVKAHPKEKKAVIGTFQCDCGFVYTRHGPEKGEQERYSYHYVKQYGDIWEEKLKHLLTVKKMSQQEVAKYFQVSWVTVKKYSAQLARNRRLMHMPDEKRIVKKRAQYREQWLRLRQKYPQKGKTELSVLMIVPFQWLAKHDSEWLFENSPPLQKAKRYHHAPIDWLERDQDLLKKCKEAVYQLLHLDKPTRITINSIGEAINSLYLLIRNSAKLPQTINYLLSVVESHEDFQCRRIQIASHVLYTNRETINRSKLIRMAHIDSNKMSPKVKMQVEYICRIHRR
ncbi:hypothetical protein HGO21_08485 [Acinetobacter sp. CUI P1]|nr:hypothetical protein [Acinetobacter sp. CUI P1]